MDAMESCLCHHSREKTMQESANYGLDGILEQVLNLNASLNRPDQLIASIKAQHIAVEASLKDLDLMVQHSRSEIESVAQRIRDEMAVQAQAGEVDVVALEQARDNVKAMPSSTKLNEVEGDVALIEVEISASKVANNGEHEVDAEDCENSQSLSKGMTDNAVVNKLMAEHRQAKAMATSLDLLWQKGKWHYAQGLCRRIVESPIFEAVLSVVIFVNAITIGIEADMSIQNDEEEMTWSLIVEVLFLVIYILELIIRLVANKWRCFRDPWFIFDFVLVTVSLLGQVIGAVASFPAVIQQVLILRALRLLRVIRALRMIKQMRGVWRLVSGLLTSCNTMMSTLALLSLVLYIFAVLGIEMIAKDDTLQADVVTSRIIQENFSSLFVIMMTLSQFVTMDSIASIYIPLIKKKPELSSYFIALVIIVSIALMNLVTAVLVEGALDHARQEKEEDVKLSNSKFREMIPQLQSLFESLDTDKSGELQRTEIEAAEREKRAEIPADILDKASVASMTELFEKLDVDKSGSLKSAEFIEGCMNIFLLEIPVRDLMMMKMIRLVRSGVAHIEDEIRDLRRSIHHPDP